MSVESGKRSRKQTNFFAVVPEEKKALSAQEGSGIALGDNPYFLEQIEKLHGGDEVLKALHSLFFHSPGKKHEVKKHLRMFNGFAEDVDPKAIVQRIADKKKIWTVAVLKEALGLFGLLKGGDREELIERLVEYLVKPEVSSKRKTTKRKSSKKTKAPKKKRAPSAYILFSSAHRAEVREANPAADFTEMAKLLADLWNKAGAEEKESWQKKSDEAKAALKDEEGAADDFETDDEEEANVEDKEDDKEEGDDDNDKAEDNEVEEENGEEDE